MGHEFEAWTDSAATFVATHHVPDGWPRPGSTVEFVTASKAPLLADETRSLQAAQKPQ